MVIQVTNYVFAPGGAGVGTITFSGYVSIELKNIILITNVTDGEIIYNFRIPGNTGTVATNVLTLMESTAAMSAGDELQIIYNDPTLSADTSTLAKEAGGNLAAIAASLAILDNIVSVNRGLVTEDNSAAIKTAVEALAAIITGGTLDVSGAVTVTSGAITETNSADIKTAVEILAAIVTGGTLDISGTVTEVSAAAILAVLQQIETAIEIIDNAIAGNEMQVDVITQPARSETTDAITIYGSDDGGTTKRVIKTDSGGAVVVDMETSALALETTLQAVKTAVEVLAAIVTGGTLDISGTVTANAGSNLDTSALALEATLQSVLTGIGQIEAAVEIIDNAIAGNEMQVDVITQPARVATTDSISSKDSTDVIQNGLVALTPKFAIIDAATSGDNTLLAAVTSKKIRIISLYMVAAAAVNARFESGTGGTALSGQMNLAANGGFVLPYNPVGWFETASGVLFNLELSGAVSVDGGFTYIEV